MNAGDSTYKSPFVGSRRVFRYLHCGDFRACPQHVLHSEVKGKKVDVVYLDTTYLDPKVVFRIYFEPHHHWMLMTSDQYCFPPQPLVISACAELADRIVHPPDKAKHSDNASVKVRNSLADWAVKKDKGKGTVNAQDERILVVVG